MAKGAEWRITDAEPRKGGDQPGLVTLVDRAVNDDY